MLQLLWFAHWLADWLWRAGWLWPAGWLRAAGGAAARGGLEEVCYDATGPEFAGEGPRESGLEAALRPVAL